MMKLGSYQLLRPIGRGGMGDIWLAAQVGPGGFKRPAVVKRLLESLTDEGEFLEMFLEEARLAALIHHPNVVSVFDFARDGGTYFLAMEYVHGVTLRSLLKTAKAKNMMLPEPVVATIAAQALNGLAAAHELLDEHGQPLDLVHRDVSPDNIMVGFDGLVKMLDFGIAKASTSNAVTRVGTMKGKLSYMPPEAVAGKTFDARGDIWSMGVVLYESVTQVRPFAADNDAALLASVVNAEPISPAALNLELSANFDSLIRYALAKSPDERPNSARAFAEALTHVPGGLMTQQELSEFIREFADEETSMAPSSVIGEMAAQPGDPHLQAIRKRAARWWWALAALVIAIAAGLLLAWRLGAFTAPLEETTDASAKVKPVPYLPPVVLNPSREQPVPAVTPPARTEMAAELVRDAGIDETAVAPRGWLEIRAPAGSEISVDGKVVGTAPLAAVRVKPGTHTVSVFGLKNRRRKTVKVHIEPGKTEPVTVDR